jgi:hypothetical protein
MPERPVIVVFKTRCRFCHAILEAGLMHLFPKFAGPPQVRCKRCDRATKLSLVVAAASVAAGFIVSVLTVVCYDVVAGSILGEPLGTAALLLMLPIGLAAWVLGYIAFASCCYGIHGIWKLFVGTD